MRVFGSLFLIAQASFCFGQADDHRVRIDPLERVIRESVEDTAVAQAYLGLTAILQAAHPDTIAPLCGAAKRIAENNLARTDLTEAERRSFKRSMAGALNYLGTFEMYSGSAAVARSQYARALSIARELDDQQLIGESLSNIGGALLTAGDLENARRYFDSAVVVHERIGYEQGLVMSRSNIAYIFKLQGRLALALRIFMGLMEKQRALGDEAGIANSLLNLGEIQYMLDNDPASIDACSKALAIYEKLNDEYSLAIVYSDLGATHGRHGDLDKAIEYLTKALDIQTRSGFRVDAGVSLGNLASLYSRLGNTTKALEQLTRAIDLFRETGAEENLSNSLSSMGMIHFNAGRILDAERFGKESLRLAQKVQVPWAIAGAADLMSKVHQRRSEWRQALEMELLLKTMQDSLVNDSNKTAATETRFRIEYAQMAFADSLEQSEAKKLSDARIATQEARLESERVQRYALFGGLALAIVFSTILFDRFRKTRRQKHEIAVQKRNVEQLLETRSDLVQTLSHSIRNPLTTMSLDVGAGASSISPGQLKRIKNGVDQITKRLDFLDSVAQLERGVMHLDPQPVDLRRKLADVVDNYSHKIEKSRMRIEADIDGKDIQVNLDWGQLEMAIENLLDNAIKYNKAGTTIRVKLNVEQHAQGERNIVLTIADDGRGISASDLARVKEFGVRGTRPAGEASVPGTGIGLYHVDQVVKLHGGKLTIISAEGAGSEFRIRLPLLNEQNPSANERTSNPIP